MADVVEWPPVEVDIPCPECGNTPLWRRGGSIYYCGKCGDDVISPSIWQTMGIPTITVNQLVVSIETAEGE